MAERFEAPVRVTDVAGQRLTVLAGDSLAVGVAVSRRRRRLGFPGLLAPGAEIPSGEVFNNPSGATAVPEVFLDVGDQGASGGITVRDDTDQPIINLNGASGFGTFGTNKGPGGGIVVRSGRSGPVIFVTGKDGRITFFDRSMKATLVIDGVRGDIEFVGGDCAEDFDLAEPAEPGSVLCVNDDQRLRPCREPYDRRVVGVISGAGEWRPGLRLGRRADNGASVPLALVGRVYCLADASLGPIGVGDLLTTSSTCGHAMRAADPLRAFGAVLGKSLGVLREGCGLVPVLVALQ